MTNRILSKLFPPHESINILHCTKETILPKICSGKKCICSFNRKLHKHTNSQDSNILSVNSKGSLCRNCQISMNSLSLCSFPQYSSRNVHPDAMFLRKCNNLGVTPLVSRCALMHTGSSGKLLFCTTFNVNALWNNKLIISKETQNQGQIQLHTQESEIQPVVCEGIGWAGQPIVKRTHAILPEVYGDVSDVFTALNQLSNSQNCENNLESDSTLQVQNSDLIEVRSSECFNQNSNPDCNNCHDQNTIESCIKSHDNISLMNSSNNLSTSAENLHIDQNELRQPVTNFVKEDLSKSRSNYFDDNGHEEDVMPEIITETSKSKLKKKTKVIGVKNIKGVNKLKMVRKKKTKVFGPRRKHKSQTQIVLCQRNKSLYCNSENIFLTENRQLMTDTALSYPRTSMALNKNKSNLSVDKNKYKISKKTNKRNSEIASDDCICPETIEVKQKKYTKVCGEAAEGEKKEKKKLKSKMCKIEPIMKYRQNTVVCASAAHKGKRKRQLPKCPEPDKKVAPRTEVCPPQLYDEAKAAEKCVKRVEEVKIRKRTKVCKPVIIYAKEEASIKIEKTVCAQSHMKQTISTHTKICPPLNNKMEKSKRKRN